MPTRHDLQPLGAHGYEPDQPVHTPGPWLLSFADNGIACIHDAHGKHFANFRDLRDGARGFDAARAVECVNACEGIADPAAALAEVRATMRGVLTMLEDCADGRDPASNDYIACQNLRAVLALLDPSTAAR